jgi:hypothetical protein
VAARVAVAAGGTGAPGGKNGGGGREPDPALLLAFTATFAGRHGAGAAAGDDTDVDAGPAQIAPAASRRPPPQRPPQRDDADTRRPLAGHPALRAAACTFLRRVLTVPYLRRIDLGWRCLRDAGHILAASGARGALRALLEVRRVLAASGGGSDGLYLFNTLVLDDACVWLLRHRGGGGGGGGGASAATATDGCGSSGDLAIAGGYADDALLRALGAELLALVEDATADGSDSGSGGGSLAAREPAFFAHWRLGELEDGGPEALQMRAAPPTASAAPADGGEEDAEESDDDDDDDGDHDSGDDEDGTTTDSTASEDGNSSKS